MQTLNKDKKAKIHYNIDKSNVKILPSDLS